MDCMVKSLPAMWETWVQSLGQEDPLEKEMAPHSSTLAWKIPWTEEPGGLQSRGSQRVGNDYTTNAHVHKTSAVKALLFVFLMYCVILYCLKSKCGQLIYEDRTQKSSTYLWAEWKVHMGMLLGTGSNVSLDWVGRYTGSWV